MRRLTVRLLLAAVLFASCRPRDKIRLEPTEENIELFSTVNMADSRAARQLIRGFHSVEQNSWRWTKREFSVLLKPPPGAAGLRVIAEIGIPDTVVQRLGSITLTARLKDAQIGSATYTSPGTHTFEAPLPAGIPADEPLTVDFSVDKYLPGGAADERELGIIVSQVSLQ